MKELLHDKRLRVDRHGKVDLNAYHTDLPKDFEKKELKKFLEKDRERISDLQELLYAADRAHHMTTVVQPGAFAPNVEQLLMNRVNELIKMTAEATSALPPQ